MKLGGYMVGFSTYRYKDDAPHVVCAVSNTVEGPYIGVARCATSDNFRLMVGRKVALTKAMQNMPKDTRTAIWVDYLKNIKD